MNTNDDLMADLERLMDKEKERLAGLGDATHAAPANVDFGYLERLRRRRTAGQLAASALCLTTAVGLALYFSTCVLNFWRLLLVVPIVSLFVVLAAVSLRDLTVRANSLIGWDLRQETARYLSAFSLREATVLSAVALVAAVCCTAVLTSPTLGYGPSTADASQMINTINQTLVA